MKWIKRKRSTEYDYSNRDKHHRFYSSAEWQRLRLIKLNESPLCELCLTNNLIEPATVVDHVESLTDNYLLRLTYDNLQSLCDICHNRKSKEEQTRYNRQLKKKKCDEVMDYLNDF